MIDKWSLCPDKHALMFSFASAKFQLRYLLSSVQKYDVSGGWGVRVGSGSAKVKDQPSANQLDSVVTSDHTQITIQNTMKIRNCG